MDIEQWELLSYVATVIGFPMAIIVYILDQRKERQNEEEEIYQRLSDEYAEFSKLLLENADLLLISQRGPRELSKEDQERKRIIYDILISLFERAYILVYEEKMSKQTQRLWASWEDYIKFWCKRQDFREALPELLKGEDPDFGAYMMKILNSTTPSALT